MAVLYFCDEQGERTGGAGVLSMGGAGGAVAVTDWQQHVGFATVPDDVPTIRVNLRLNHARGVAWFDDVALFPYPQEPLTRPRPLRRGIRLQGPEPVGIVTADGADDLAERIHGALTQRGFDAEVIGASDSAGL